MFSAVGDAIRGRSAPRRRRRRRLRRRQCREEGEAEAKGGKGKKKSKDGDGGSGGSRGGGKRGAAGGSSGGGGGSSASNSAGNGAAPAVHGMTSASDVPSLLEDLVGALQGYDARLPLPAFLEQVSAINARLGKATDPRQLGELFAAVQVNGYVDFADFLRRQSTRAYFEMSETSLAGGLSA